MFTNPGERVNHPEFGSGLLAMVFAGNHPAISDTLDAAVRAAVEQFFSRLIDLEDLKIQQTDALLQVEIQYRTRPDGVRQRATFRQEVSS